MSWPMIVLGFCVTLVLAGCGQPQAPATDASAQSGVPHEDPRQKAARARLTAVIRDQSFLDHLPDTQRVTTISEPLAERMVIMYLVDDGGAARGAQDSDLAESGVTREALRAVVDWNLARLLGAPVSCTSHAVTEPARRNYYESSRLLLSKQWADLAARAGTLVVAAPSNDMLVVACNPTPQVLQRLSVIVQNNYPQAPRPVSPSLLTWSEGGWQELPAP
ncbi:MAG TPA: DUF1444 family protein [Polyangiaceae bacterium]|nr:DUF1444 family protein [Polyangiaceae bacterium]